jgi:cholesterol oxidase
LLHVELRWHRIWCSVKPACNQAKGQVMKTKFDFDVIVIGSGFGGGTVALRLAQAGKRVCVLERGRRWRGKNMPPAAKGQPQTTSFPEIGDKHFFWGREFWRPMHQRLGLYDLKQLSNLQGLVGAGVGGGSLIWANVVVEAPESVFASGWPSDINPAVLEPYYRKADPFLRPMQVPGVNGNPSKYSIARADALKATAAKLKLNWKPVDVAINFGDEITAQPNGHGSAKQRGCNFCGLCTAGCPQNAKNTVDITYIAEAEKLGVDVRAQHQVDAIGQTGDGYYVTFAHYDVDGTLASRGILKAPQVVLAAGSFGSTELLLRCRDGAYLPNLSAALGSQFSINGNVLSGALDPNARSNPALNNGPAITGMIDYGNFAVEDISNPTWAAGIVGEGQYKRAWSFIRALAGFKPSKKTLEQARDLLVYVGVGKDSAKGRLELNAFGELSMNWEGGIENEPVVKALHAEMSKLAAAQGRTYVPNVFSVFNRPVTYHPLGGCPMAESAQKGVVDSYGRVFGYPGLFIADGSIVPTAIGRNPSYTIAALAERVAEAMVEKK